VVADGVLQLESGRIHGAKRRDRMNSIGIHGFSSQWRQSHRWTVESLLVARNMNETYEQDDNGRPCQVRIADKSDANHPISVSGVSSRIVGNGLAASAETKGNDTDGCTDSSIQKEN
jgi:hypothetical protein